MTRKTLFSVPILLVAVSCAGNRAESRSEPSAANDIAQATASKSDEDPICGLEYPTGSHIARRVCRTPEDTEEEREATQQWIDSQQHIQQCKQNGDCRPNG